MHLTLKDMEPKSKYILVEALNKHVPCFLLKSVTRLELCSHSSEAVFISSCRQLGNRFPILLKLGKISYQDLFKCVYKCSASPSGGLQNVSDLFHLSLKDRSAQKT